MTALAKSFDRRSMGLNAILTLGFAIGLAADAVIYKGSAVAINRSGYLVPASADPTLHVVGVSDDEKDNTGGAAGALSLRPKRGPHYFSNSATTAAVTDLDIGRPCYVVDDNTVARHDALGTRPVMGIVEGVDDFGVLVSVGLPGPAADGSIDVIGIAGADLSARLHLPVKLNGSGAVVSATTAGEFAWGIQQNAPASGAAVVVRVFGRSRVILGATLAEMARVAVQATTGRMKAAVGGTVAGGAGDPTNDALVASNCLGFLLVGGADGDTGVMFVNPMGAIPTTAA